MLAAFKAMTRPRGTQRYRDLHPMCAHIHLTAFLFCGAVRSKTGKAAIYSLILRLDGARYSVGIGPSPLRRGSIIVAVDGDNLAIVTSRSGIIDNPAHLLDGPSCLPFRSVAARRPTTGDFARICSARSPAHGPPTWAGGGTASMTDATARRPKTRALTTTPHVLLIKHS
jgi:hypothetical protein